MQRAAEATPHAPAAHQACKDLAAASCLHMDRRTLRSRAVPRGWAQLGGRACLWLAQPQRTRHWPTTMPFIVWIARSASSCVLTHRRRAVR